MKKIIFLSVAMAVTALFGSCTDDPRPDGGDGYVSITASVNDDMHVMTSPSRAITDTELEDLKANATVWITQKGKGVVRKYKGLENVPATIGLKSGQYIAEVWAGDSVAASWDKKWYRAYVPFEVEYGKVTEVKAECNIVNVAVAVRYPEGIEEVLSDIAFTVNHPKAELVFNGTEDAANKTAYFMMNSTDKDLRYTLTGTQIDGVPVTITNTLKGVKSGIKYILKVKYDPEGEVAGGVAFDFVVEEEPMGTSETNTIVAPPTIVGYGFNINENQVVPVGKVGRKVVHIISATNVVEAVITSDVFKPFLGSVSADLTRVNDDTRNLLAANGLSFKYHDPSEAVDDDNVEGSDHNFEGATSMHINFEDKMLNALQNGDYSFLISALDDQGNRSVRALRFKVTSSSAQTIAPTPTDVTYESVTLRAVLLKDGVEKVGFNWRKEGDVDWNYIDGVVTSRSYDSGTQFQATITDLADGQVIEYAPVADEYVDVVSKITSKRHSYLPNGGFEDWIQNTKGAWLVCAKESEMFWDSGNHGSITTGTNVTEPDGNIKVSGNYSIKLESKYPSVLGIGKFAAGNVFIGKYLATNGTNGVLGWGRPWSERPKGLRGYVRYRPVAIDQPKADKGYNKGDMDKGLVKIALVNNSVAYGSEEYGFVVKTADGDAGLFQDDGSYVVSLGRLVLTEATPGDGFIEFDIPLEDVNPGPFNRIIIVASSSMGGDYFAGGVGSTMWLDDIQIYY